MEYISESPESTQELAANLAQQLIGEFVGKPIVIALEGELGAGKTTFTQAFCKALGVVENVKSPTFVLMKDYPLENIHGYQRLYHLDCYRLNNPADLKPLGLEEIINKSGTIVLIEWAERVAEILPPEHITIHLDHISEQTRNITIHEKDRIN